MLILNFQNMYWPSLSLRIILSKRTSQFSLFSPTVSVYIHNYWSMFANGYAHYISISSVSSLLEAISQVSACYLSFCSAPSAQLSFAGAPPPPPPFSCTLVSFHCMQLSPQSICYLCDDGLLGIKVVCQDTTKISRWTVSMGI